MNIARYAILVLPLALVIGCATESEGPETSPPPADAVIGTTQQGLTKYVKENYDRCNAGCEGNYSACCNSCPSGVGLSKCILGKGCYDNLVGCYGDCRTIWLN